MRPTSNVSVPANTKTPRDLTAKESATLARVADTLIPAADGHPAGSREQGFWDAVPTALNARAETFDEIVDALGALSHTADNAMWAALRELNSERFPAFQALSTIVTWAWLQAPDVRTRLAYRGQQAEKAGLEEAADEIFSGILDPVINRGSNWTPGWIKDANEQHGTSEYEGHR
ncbi:hypothetical protein [Paenarthrobacter nicotinovorans]|uniref:hypothetical protein n=1 Tax=Paenarthrobacter nicotinovorans TaxID=29320 RepID=UPI003D67A69D